jgi:hypothetical protein
MDDLASATSVDRQVRLAHILAEQRLARQSEDFRVDPDVLRGGPDVTQTLSEASIGRHRGRASPAVDS